MAWDANELHWKPYPTNSLNGERTKLAWPMATPIEAAWDNLLRTLAASYLGSRIVYTTTLRQPTESHDAHAHKLEVFKALVLNDLEPASGITDRVVYRAELYGEEYEGPMAVWVYKVEADDQVCYGLLYTAHDRMVLFVKQAEQTWWATRANVAWDLFPNG